MASISSAGIGSGLDVQSIVSQLMAIERQPLERLQVKQQQIEAQISAYGQLRSTLSDFQSAMTALGSDDALKVFSTSSSNPDVVDITATSNADIGSFGIEVTRIAQFHKLASTEALDTDTFGGNAGDSLTIQVGADVADSISIDLGTASTLSEIRTAINEHADNPGVQATIIHGDNNNQKLVLTARDSGADGALTLSYGGSINAGTFKLQTLNNTGANTSLLDAELIVDGYSITRSTNNISDIVSGVTINLRNADPGTVHTVSIDRDIDAVEAAVQSFADAFNDLRTSIKSLKSGQLEADSSLLSIERQIFGVLNTPASGGTYSTLSEVGLLVQKDGLMTLSGNNLRAALESDFSAVSQLFAEDGQGFANRLETLVDAWLGSDGMIEARTDGLEARIDTIVDRQVSFERNLLAVEERYRAQFTALDSLVGQLQSTGQFLTQQLAQLPGSK